MIRAMTKRFLRDESGATAIEYALIATLIAMVIIGSLRSIGTTLSTTFSSIGTTISSTTR